MIISETNSLKARVFKTKIVYGNGSQRYLAIGRIVPSCHYKRLGSISDDSFITVYHEDRATQEFLHKNLANCQRRWSDRRLDYSVPAEWLKGWTPMCKEEAMGIRAKRTMAGIKGAETKQLKQLQLEGLH